MSATVTFVDQQLRVTAERIADAIEALAARECEAAWLEQCQEREVDVDETGDTLEPTSWLRTRLGLTPTEVRVVWVLVAQELCVDARAHLRELATENELDVTLDVLRRVVYGSRPDARAWRELAPTGTLRMLRLIEPVTSSTDGAAHRTTFRVSRRVLALVHGIVELDEELRGCARIEAGTTSFDELIVAADPRERIRSRMTASEGLTVVHGPGGSGRRSLALAAAREAGRTVLTMDARHVSAQRDLAERQLRIVARECKLLECIPLISNLDSLVGSAEIADRLDLVETCLEGSVFATAPRLASRPWSTSPVAIELVTLDGAQCASLWKRALPAASDGDADLLATMYPLAPAMIRAIGRVSIDNAAGASLEPHHIQLGMRSVLDDRLAGLATRVTVTQTWDDLVLPEDQTMGVVELLARIRQRRRVYETWGFADKLGKGLGVTALFSGPPGTGKTMCAGLIAKDLGTELFQVDLGKITSKWIGETEKNLGALFDAAEAGHAILLFDEADALFGKRTGVSSSNDRHANQETNYLLQRLESFSGICILTTNHDHAIDEAFRRRLSAHVRFPLPDAEEREKLWRALLPARAPIDADLDHAALARKYEMSGGYIRNAVLRAAFLAADANEPIGQYHLATAAQLEYEGMGRITMGAS